MSPPPPGARSRGDLRVGTRKVSPPAPPTTVAHLHHFRAQLTSGSMVHSRNYHTSSAVSRHSINIDFPEQLSATAPSTHPSATISGFFPRCRRVPILLHHMFAYCGIRMLYQMVHPYRPRDLTLARRTLTSPLLSQLPRHHHPKVACPAIGTKVDSRVPAAELEARTRSLVECKPPCCIYDCPPSPPHIAEPATPHSLVGCVRASMLHLRLFYTRRSTASTPMIPDHGEIMYSPVPVRYPRSGGTLLAPLCPPPRPDPRR